MKHSHIHVSQPSLIQAAHSRRRLVLAAAGFAMAPALAGCGGSGGGKEGIWKVAAAGGEPKLLANYPARPVWSPDGKSIIWSSQNGVWLASSDGVEPHRLIGVHNPPPPSYSPDGSRVAVMDPEGHALHILGGDGRNESSFPVGDAPRAGDAAPSVQRNIPAWSPDGTAILVSGWNGGGDGIYRVDVSTGESVEISEIRRSNVPFDSGDPASPMQAMANAVWPAWSPSGKAIAFAVLPQASTSLNGVYTIPASGGAQQRLASIAPSFGPLWSREGKSLLTVAPTDKGVRLVLVSAATGDMSALPTPANMVPIDADWSPDGSRIAFSAGGAIHVIETSSGKLTTIADTPLTDLSPVWSPDGQWIAFRSEQDHFDQPALPATP